MNPKITYSNTLAQSNEFLEGIGYGMRTAGERVDLWSLSIFLFIPLTLSIIYALVLIYRYLFQNHYDAPNILFTQLCSAHGLTFFERRVLRHAAVRWQVADPCLLFIDQELWKFDDSVRQIPPSYLKQKDSETYNLLSLYSRLMRDLETSESQN